MQRIVVVGTTGSGKSTLGEALAKRLDAAFIELDSLYWQAGWQAPEIAAFRARVADAASAERWVASGNFSKARDVLWTRADTLVWLDYSFPLVFSRLLRRTVRRIITRENLWNSGNYETWRKSFFDRDSILVWAVKTHWKYPQYLAEPLTQPQYAHLKLIRLKSPRETERWMKTL